MVYKADVYTPVKKVPGRNGAYFNKYGYVLVQVRRGCFALEHRIKVERVLGRRLKHTEEVNHINGVKYDNRNSNLFVSSHAYHEAWHRRCYRRFGSWYPPIYDDPAKLSKMTFDSGIPLTSSSFKGDSILQASSRSAQPKDAVITMKQLLGLY